MKKMLNAFSIFFIPVLVVRLTSYPDLPPSTPRLFWWHVDSACATVLITCSCSDGKEQRKTGKGFLFFVLDRNYATGF